MPRLASLLIVLLGLYFAIALAAGDAAAAVIAPGDLIVADVDAFLVGAVFRINPVTGTVAVAAGGPGAKLSAPAGVATAPTGDLFVVDLNCCGGGQGGVVRVNPTTGQQTVVASRGNFVDPRGIALASSGDLFVVDEKCCGHGGVIRIHPATGQQTVVASGGNFGFPTGIALAPTGELFIADPLCCGGSPGGVVRIDPATGQQTVAASRGNLVKPFGIAVGPGGDLFVLDQHCCIGGRGGVIRVNPATGQQTVLASGGEFAVPIGIAIGPGDVFVLDANCCPDPTDMHGGGVIRVHPITGHQTVVANGGSFRTLAGIALAPPLVVTGAGPAGGPHVRAFETAFGTERFGFFAYDPGFTGGVHVAVGDVNGDGVPDVITGPGPGGGPHVKVFDGASLLSGNLGGASDVSRSRPRAPSTRAHASAPTPRG